MDAPVIHFEIGVKNGEKCSEFYAQVFDWVIKLDEKKVYGSVESEICGIGGGIMQADAGPIPPYVTFYIEVDDVQNYLNRVEAQGGKTAFTPTKITGVGWIGWFHDPDNNLIGLWKK